MNTFRNLCLFLLLISAGSAKAEDSSALLAATTGICFDKVATYEDKLSQLSALGWNNLVSAEEYSAADHAFVEGLIATELNGNRTDIKEELDRFLKYNSGAKQRAERLGYAQGLFKFGASETSAYLAITRRSKGFGKKTVHFDGPSYCSIAFAAAIDPSPALSEGQSWGVAQPSKMGTYYRQPKDSQLGQQLIMAANVSPAGYEERAGQPPTILTYVTIYPSTESLEAGNGN